LWTKSNGSLPAWIKKIRMTVITTCKFYYFISFGKPACQSYSAHTGFGTEFTNLIYRYLNHRNG
jgi:hypothetical protein